MTTAKLSPRCIIVSVFLALYLAPQICNATDVTSVKITLNATWTVACTKTDQIKTSIRSLFVSRRTVVIDVYRFVYPTLGSNCLQSSTSSNMAVLSLFISKKAPDNGTVDAEETEKLSQLIHAGDSIASEKVLSVEAIMASSSRQIFSTNVIVAMIVVVSIVYLIGFGLIVLTQSEGDTSKGVPVSYLISSHNQGYKRQVTPSAKRR